MPIYLCEHCNFSSKLKGDYKRHLESQKHKNAITSEGIKNTKEHKKNTKEHKKNTKEHKRTQKKKYICDHCDEEFFSFPSKRRHELHFCKMSPYVEEKKEKEKMEKEKELYQQTIKVATLTNDNKYKSNEIVKLEKEKEKLEKKVDKLTNKIGNTITNNIQTNSTCTNTSTSTNNIKINSYGKEDVSHITDAFKTEMLKIPYGAIPELIKAIHYNDQKPANQNVKMPNVNKNILKVKSDDGWSHKHKNLILYDMIDSKYLMLDDHFELLVDGEKLNTHNKSNYKKFRDKYDIGDKKLLTELKDECELIMLDKRDEE